MSIALAADLPAQLLPEQAQLLTERSSPPYGPPETNGDFAQAMASGDFNGDGYEDLAVGRPSQNDPEPGVVYILSGGPAGLSFSGELLGPDTTSDFGQALAVCDLDDDGLDDLIVADPRYNTGVVAGRVFTYRSTGLIFGAPFELLQMIDQASSGMGETPETNDAFGAALATGRFDDDDSCDLAIGVPGESFDFEMTTRTQAGVVHVLDNDGAGSLQTIGSRLLTAGDANADPASFDLFGATLAAGRMDAVAGEELLVGAPEKDVSGVNEAGMVFLFFGNNPSFPASGTGFTTPQLTGESQALAHENFGAALTVCDFDGDGLEDPVMGAPGFRTLGGDDVGVAIFVSTLDLLTVAPVEPIGRVLSQRMQAMPLPGEQFGAALVSGYFDGDVYCDLAVAASRDAFQKQVGYGAVHVLFGSATGPSFAREQLIVESDVGAARERDAFGSTLAVGAFTSRGADELVVGVPGKDDVLGTRGFAEGDDEGAAYRVPVVGQALPGRLHVLTRSTLPDSSGRLVMELSDPDSDSQGRVGYRGRFDDGESFVSIDGAIVFEDSDESTVNLGGFLVDPGFVLGENDRFAYVDALGIRGAQPEALYTSSGVLALASDLVDGLAVGQPRGLLNTGSDRLHFRNVGPAPDLTARSAPQFGTPLALELRLGSPVGGFFVESIARFDVSASGAHHLVRGTAGQGASIEVVVLDGNIIAKSMDTLAGLTGVESFGDVAVNDDGELLLSAFALAPLARGGGPSPVPMAVVFGGEGGAVTTAVTAAEGPGVFFTPTGLALDEHGARLMLWSDGSLDRLYLACDADLAAATLLLRTGQELDFDDDGVADASVLGISQPSSPQVLEPSALGELLLRVDLERGSQRYQAIVGLEVDCGFFRDGFESGDLQGWSSATGS